MAEIHRDTSTMRVRLAIRQTSAASSCLGDSTCTPWTGCERPPLHVGIRFERAKGILTRTSGFIRAAGFTHSLSPARNCTFGCLYCYVQTLGIFGGLRQEDRTHWGEFTTIKTNAPVLLRRALRPDHIYCSPLVDPYQPAEAAAVAMPPILDEVAQRPPRVFVIQTRGPLILRDLDAIVRLASRTSVRISFSLTTNREDIRRLYELHCAPIEDRLCAMERLRAAGLEVYATLAPLLPCDPEELARLAIDATDRDIIADPLHTRGNRPHGAVTRDAACRARDRLGLTAWHDAVFQAQVVEGIRRAVEAAGRRLGVGPAGFGWLAAT